MNLKEYNEIKDLTYREYCDYLKKKYGVAKVDYMTKSFNKNPKITRTKEGLFVHHKYEDCAIMLSTKEFAMNNPFEWQKAENMVYCDFLEHLLLHILICEYPNENKNEFEAVGIGGAINFIIPELNDLYSGLPINLEWKQICFNKVKDDLDCYLTLINRLMKKSCNYPCYEEEKIFSSFNENYGTWSSTKNKKLYEKIRNYK